MVKFCLSGGDNPVFSQGGIGTLAFAQGGDRPKIRPSGGDMVKQGNDANLYDVR